MCIGMRIVVYIVSELCIAAQQITRWHSCRAVVTILLSFC